MFTCNFVIWVVLSWVIKEKLIGNWNYCGEDFGWVKFGYVKWDVKATHLELSSKWHCLGLYQSFQCFEWFGRAHIFFLFISRWKMIGINA